MPGVLVSADVAQEGSLHEWQGRGDKSGTGGATPKADVGLLEAR